MQKQKNNNKYIDIFKGIRVMCRLCIAAKCPFPPLCGATTPKHVSRSLRI